MGTLTFHHLSCSFDTFFFMVCGGFWAATKAGTGYSWCSPSVVNVLNMAEIEEQRGMRSSFEMRVILCAVRRGQSSYSHSPPVLTSNLCCSLAKYKMGLGVKGYYILLSSIHIDCLQSSHGARSAVIWLFRRSMHSHSQQHKFSSSAMYWWHS